MMLTQHLAIFGAAITAIVRDPNQADLSARQLAILLRVYDAPRATITVRGLAQDLHVSKPAITRGIDRLAKLGLVSRVEDLDDRRSLFVVIELAGQAFVNRLIRQMQMHDQLRAA